MNKKSEKEIRKVWTTYRITSPYPYIVYAQIGDEKTDLTFVIRFFAIRKAKKIARILGVDPDLSFTPAIR